MQRVSPRALLLITALTGALMAGMLVVFMLTFGSQPAPKAFAIVTPPANTPTPTCEPSPSTAVPNKCLPKGTPTPKPGGISGVYDIAAWLTAPPQPDKGKEIYRCMSRVDEYGAPHPLFTLKSTAVCYVNIGGSGIGDPNAEPPGGSAKPPMGPGGAPGGSPPPPFTTLAPQKGYGNIIGGTLHSWTCFQDIGGILGPNLIAEVIIPNFQEQIDNTVSNGIKHAAIAGAGAPGPLGGANAGLYLTGSRSQLECEGLASGIIPPKLASTAAAGLYIEFHTADSNNPSCAGLPAKGAVPAGCALASWRHAGAGAPFGPPSGGYPDWDGDKCTDSDELFADKLGTKCSDDPWNPNDTNDPHHGVDGIYSISVVGAREDVCKGGTWKHQGEVGEFDCTGKPDKTRIPGLYYDCAASITQIDQDLAAKVLCVIDGILFRGGAQPDKVIYFTVNPDTAPGNATACPPAPAIYCGDGSPGAAPPGCSDTDTLCAQAMPKQVGETIVGCPALPCASTKWLFPQISIGTKPHTALTGTYNKTTNNIELSGCFNNSNVHRPPIVPVYVRAKINAHTGHGWVSLWIVQTDANCKANNPQGAATSTLPINIVRQACVPGPENPWCAGAPYVAANWDGDGDGCPDVKELGDTPGQGGKRDPQNRWDFYNPEKVNTPDTQTAADILKVVQAFGKNQGNAAYKRENDRTGIVGSNSWNLGSPDGQQTAADILATVKQFNHSCANPND